MEWNGFNNHLSRSQGTLKPTTYMFGPMIAAPPAHPDTILTTLTHMQQSLVDMGMKDVHLSMDMQLFAVTKQVCWNQPTQFKNVIIHPGGMHIIRIGYTPSPRCATSLYYDYTKFKNQVDK